MFVDDDDVVEGDDGVLVDAVWEYGTLDGVWVCVTWPGMDDVNPSVFMVLCDDVVVACANCFHFGKGGSPE